MLGVVAHAFNPALERQRRAIFWGSEDRTDWCTEPIPGQPEIM